MQAGRCAHSSLVSLASEHPFKPRVARLALRSGAAAARSAWDTRLSDGELAGTSAAYLPHVDVAGHLRAFFLFSSKRAESLPFRDDPVGPDT